MLRCNAGLFNFFTETESMPQATQRRPLCPFDAHSVLLFAALTVGGALAQAQASPAPAAQSKYQSGPGSTPIRPLAAPGGGRQPPVLAP